MRNVLYEAAFNFDLMLLIPVCMCIIIPVFPRIWKKQQKGKYNMSAYKAIKIFCAFSFTFVLILTLITGISTVYMYKKTVVAYKNEDYEIVEGYVENFVPMPYEGHSEESFEINGVKFSYSDYQITFGYNNAKSHGGVIAGNGQYLKVGYVVDNDTNIIVYIEQLTS